MRNREVMIVEDDDTTRHLFETVLSRSGITVLSACDGDAALAMLGAYDVDVILLDLLMPRCDGVEFLQKLAQQRPELTPRVIICSAAGRRTFDDAVSPRVWAALEKPLDIAVISDTVLDCLAATAH